MRQSGAGELEGYRRKRIKHRRQLKGGLSIPTKKKKNMSNRTVPYSVSNVVVVFIRAAAAAAAAAPRGEREIWMLDEKYQKRWGLGFLLVDAVSVETTALSPFFFDPYKRVHPSPFPPVAKDDLLHRRTWGAIFFWASSYSYKHVRYDKSHKRLETNFVVLYLMVRSNH